jgi:hypothetical protein
MTNNNSLIWSEQHNKRYIWLFNLLSKNNNNLNLNNYLITFNKNQLIKTIKAFDLSISSKKVLLFMVARWIEINKPDDPSINEIKNEAYKFKLKEDKENEKNELDNKEKENYEQLNYFINILDNIDFDNITDKTKHYEYLILSLLILQPPLRTSFYTSAEINKDGKMDKYKNYMWLSTNNNKAYYYVGHDKVSNSNTYNNKEELKLIQIEDPKLVHIIYKSVEKFPRKYLFEISGKPMNHQTLIKYLRNITKIIKIDINMLRSIYITDKYNYKSYGEKNELAKKMRHSVNTASINYFKLLKQPKQNGENELILELQKDNNNLKYKVNELTSLLSKFKSNEQDPEYKKKRRDIIYRANNDGFKPKEDTKLKYDIKYDEITNKYI